MRPSQPGVVPASSSPYATKSTGRGSSELIALCDQVNRTWFQRAHPLMRPSQPDVVPASSSPHAIKSLEKQCFWLEPQLESIPPHSFSLIELPNREVFHRQCLAHSLMSCSYALDRLLSKVPLSSTPIAAVLADDNSHWQILLT